MLMVTVPSLDDRLDIVNSGGTDDRDIGQTLVEDIVNLIQVRWIVAYVAKIPWSLKIPRNPAGDYAPVPDGYVVDG